MVAIPGFRTRRREDPHLEPGDRRLGARLLLAAAAATALAIPFALLAVLIREAWDPLHRVDEGFANDLHRYALAHAGWVKAVELWTNVFAPETFRVLVALLVVWLVYRRAPRLAAWAATTMIVGGLLGVLLKAIVNRARPLLPDPVSHAPGASFPSGHALNATLGCGILLLALLPLIPRGIARVAAWAVAIIVPVVTAATRVALGVHWASDVTGGIILGVGVLAATTIAFEAWRTKEEGRAPVSPVREGVEPEAAEVPSRPRRSRR